ncbi:rRNA (guanine-N1)-methyltransferase [Amycolatopsis sp. OK19-0408]|uniref:rRNA (Guanine-N1)-methyltransferase n=1 Tax=Amycolatopsis iheyensis TaxID=2945988 RepID=A0A9X2SK14_9PSEU|nr:rRNA (guanine-N1)-methyltransferase [Amycolatopsis iheyensis]MCR6484643.1 rRNA (guanine-N1)-methyltransferase [Amycolatopsis iheyensis]
MNLLHARIPAGTADTAPMVAARADFLAAGAYRPLAEELARVCAESEGLVIDAGAGTGYYLAHILDAAPAATGLALDVSAVALRRAARAHPRLGAAVWNLWERWPLGDEVASTVVNVFAPRNGPEFHRVLRPGGLLAVASPAPDHLRELGDLVLAVADRKEERLDGTLGEYFARTSRTAVRRTTVLPPDQVRQAVAMGPAGHHLDKGGRRERLAAISEAQEVTVSFTISTYRRL